MGVCDAKRGRLREGCGAPSGGALDRRMHRLASLGCRWTQCHHNGRVHGACRGLSCCSSMTQLAVHRGTASGWVGAGNGELWPLRMQESCIVIDCKVKPYNRRNEAGCTPNAAKSFEIQFEKSTPCERAWGRFATSSRCAPSGSAMAGSDDQCVAAPSAWWHGWWSGPCAAC